MEYNTERNHLTMKEYGRHIQRMVEHVLTIEDRQQRQQQAQVVIELMGFLNPHLKNVEDFRHLLWDHLFFVSDFKLDVDCPYPIPTRETYKQKPDPLPYPKRKPKAALRLVHQCFVFQNEPVYFLPCLHLKVLIVCFTDCGRDNISHNDQNGG